MSVARPAIYYPPTLWLERVSLILAEYTDTIQYDTSKDTTNKSQEVSPSPAGDHKAYINRRSQRHSKHKTEKNIKDPQKKYRLGTVSKIVYWRA